MTEYAKQRQHILTTLQYKLMQIKKTYANILYDRRGEGWMFIAEAFRTIALYLQAEIVRCKHETVAYMKGLDAADMYGEDKEIVELGRSIVELAKLLGEEEKITPNRVIPENHPMILSKMNVIKQQVKAVEEVTYAGQ